jgi:hypothetical protein
MGVGYFKREKSTHRKREREGKAGNVRRDVRDCKMLGNMCVCEGGLLHSNLVIRHFFAIANSRKEELKVRTVTFKGKWNTKYVKRNEAG